MPFGKKMAVLFDWHYRFNISRSPHASLQRNIKNRLSNKTFRFLCLQAPEKKFEAVLFEVVSRRIVGSTTAQYQCFLDVRTFSGLDFLLLKVHQ